MEINKKNRCVFFLLNGIALLLVLSWMSQWTAPYWATLDLKAFYFFNGWIAENRTAQFFWAIANFRPFDLIPISIIIFSVTAGDWFIEKKIIREKSLLFLILIIFMVIIRYIVATIYGEGRHSPSISITPVYRLTELVTYIPSKDFAVDSFPSDHAAVLFTWMGFMLIYAKKAYKPLAVFIAIFFALPRLVGGAHWITDVVVGSAFVALIAIAWVCFTPLGEKGVKLLKPFFQKIGRCCRRKETITNGTS